MLPADTRLVAWFITLVDQIDVTSKHTALGGGRINQGREPRLTDTVLAEPRLKLWFLVYC
ncbi:hypothetical protein D3C81_1857930 [compost metagenome]|jgi:hypothetical protein